MSRLFSATVDFNVNIFRFLFTTDTDQLRLQAETIALHKQVDYAGSSLPAVNSSLALSSSEQKNCFRAELAAVLLLVIRDGSSRAGISCFHRPGAHILKANSP